MRGKLCTHTIVSQNYSADHMNFLLKLAHDYSGQAIWSVVLDHLEQFKVLKQFRSKIPCFPENVVMGTISL